MAQAIQREMLEKLMIFALRRREQTSVFQRQLRGFSDRSVNRTQDDSPEHLQEIQSVRRERTRT